MQHDEGPVTSSESERGARIMPQRWEYAVLSALVGSVALVLLGVLSLGIRNNCGVAVGALFTVLALLIGTWQTIGVAPLVALVALGAIGYRWTWQAFRIEVFVVAFLILCAIAFAFVPHNVGCARSFAI